MTYKEAESKMNRSLGLLLVLFAVFLALLIANLQQLGKESPDAPLYWMLNALCLVFVVLMFRVFSFRAKRCSMIEKVWRARLEEFPLFMFLVMHKLRAEERAVLFHLWAVHGGVRASQDWAVHEVEEAGLLYKDGPLAFNHIVLSLLGNGHLEFSEKRYHHLIIGEALWDVAKKRYPLSMFSPDDTGGVEQARAVFGAR